MADSLPTAKPLPPGRSGIPFLGETLLFIKDCYHFISERVARHGPVFRTKLFGRDTVVIVGPDAAGKFIDESCVQREGGLLPHIQELFGGDALPTLDGDNHHLRKSHVMAAFSHQALTAYLPVLQRHVEASFQRWSEGGAERHLIDELKRLSIEVICDSIIGLAPGPVVDQLRRDYDSVIVGFASLPVRLPGSTFTKAKRALNHILAVYAEAVKSHRAAPREDGVSFILKHRTSDGQSITDNECATELHHIMIAGFIVFGELASILLELERAPDVRQRLAEEVDAAAKTGPLTIEGLYKMEFLNHFTMEVKRVTPIVPVVFGKARRSFELKGHTIPAGWTVLWTLYASQLSDGYSDALRFDPDRFAEGRAEHTRHPYAFTPQGAGPATGHRCAGLDLTTYLMQVFTVVLLRGYEVRLTPGQNLDYDWSKLTPEPKDGLRAKVIKTR